MSIQACICLEEGENSGQGVKDNLLQHKGRYILYCELKKWEGLKANASLFSRFFRGIRDAPNRTCGGCHALDQLTIPIIQADKRLLRHIFTNLLTNAVKYPDHSRLVQFEMECDESEIVCAIRDQGIGIPEADREWLFNAFHRGHNVGDRPGTGLGLVIVKRCLDLHGGSISVESKLGEGTVVTVRLPML